MRKRLTSEVEIVIEIKKEVEILLGTNKMAIYVYHDGSLETII
jgi:hypothetical protein